MASVLKSTVQDICTKLSENGEETFFLSVNLKDYSSTCFGSTLGKEFFMSRLDVIAQFYDYCKERVKGNQVPIISSPLKSSIDQVNADIPVSCQEEIILETTEVTESENDNTLQNYNYEEIIKNVCAALDTQENQKPKSAKMITTTAAKKVPFLKNTPKAIRTKKKSSIDEDELNEKLACILCGKKFMGQENLKAHMAVHTGGKGYRCRVCDKGFENSGNLRQHERIHLEQKPYSCHICDKKFTRNWILKAHINHHIGNRPFQCDICEKTFITRSSLNLHKSFHGGKRYDCDICGKNFTRPNSLKIHYNLHIGKDVYDCLVCGRSFGKRSHVTRHMKVHDKNRERKKPTPRPRKVKEKVRHICEICDKEFQRPYHLKRHIKVHEKSVKKEKDLEKDDIDEDMKSGDPERMLVCALSLKRNTKKATSGDDKEDFEVVINEEWERDNYLSGKTGKSVSQKGRGKKNTPNQANNIKSTGVKTRKQSKSEKVEEVMREENEKDEEIANEGSEREEEIISEESEMDEETSGEEKEISSNIEQENDTELNEDRQLNDEGKSEIQGENIKEIQA